MKASLPRYPRRLLLAGLYLASQGIALIAAGWAAVSADPPGVVAVGGDTYRVSPDFALVLLPAGVASLVASALAVSRRMYWGVIGATLLAGIVSMIAGVLNGLVGRPLLNLVALAIVGSARGAFRPAPPDVAGTVAPRSG